MTQEAHKRTRSMSQIALTMREQHERPLKADEIQLLQPFRQQSLHNDRAGHGRHSHTAFNRRPDRFIGRHLHHDLQMLRRQAELRKRSLENGSRPGAALAQYPLAPRNMLQTKLAKLGVRVSRTHDDNQLIEIEQFGDKLGLTDMALDQSDFRIPCAESLRHLIGVAERQSQFDLSEFAVKLGDTFRQPISADGLACVNVDDAAFQPAKLQQ